MKRIVRKTLGIGAATSALLIGGIVAAPTASAGGGEEWVHGTSYDQCSARLEEQVDRVRSNPYNTIDGIRQCTKGKEYWWGAVWW